jgi:predicted branched-subunit amino acid permease
MLTSLRLPGFRQGAVEALSASPGFAAWGLMTGVAMANSGMSQLEALLMALLVYAGSSQLAALPLLAAAAPMWVVLATGACVNLRFVVFSAHLRPYLMHAPLWQRLLRGYLTTDLSYVLFVKRFEHPADTQAGLDDQQAYLLGSCVVVWVAWMLPCISGVLLAEGIPNEWGLGFAGILALLGILFSLASSGLRWVSAGVAGAAAVAAYALPYKLNILLAIASAVALCLMLDGQARQEVNQGPVRGGGQ